MNGRKNDDDEDDDAGDEDECPLQMCGFESFFSRSVTKK